MVALVRCCDGTYSVALQSRLNELITQGLISEYLQEGEWVVAEQVVKWDYPPPKPSERRFAAVVSCF